LISPSVLSITFSCLCCVFILFVFVVCFVSIVACISQLSILDCPFGFLYNFYSDHRH
jgi:hypothetical protein